MPTSLCAKCRAPLGSSDRFCTSCGAPRDGAAEQPAARPRSAAEARRAELQAHLAAATQGDFVIKSELGAGGMAAVYLAEDLRLSRKVAIKVMLPHLVDVPGMAERFIAEARTAARLDHPNIVGIFTVEERRGLRFLVMKLIDGLTLSDLLRRTGKMRPALAQDVLVQIARALEFAHAAGVVHRDVKPANVMLDAKGTAIVTDFGIAKAADSTNITMTGALVGTPTYMSPEQFQGSRPSPAVDQYAFGVMAYEVLTGAPPFTGSVIDLQMAHSRHAPTTLDVRQDGWTPELSGAVMRMLSKRPEDRFPSLRDARVVLGSALLGSASDVRDELAALVHRAMQAPEARPNRGVAAAPVPAGPPPPPGQARAHSLLVLPTSLELTLGTTAQLEVAVLDAKGLAIIGRTILWSVTDPRVASVSPSGVVSALAEGATQVRAQCESLTATCSISVRKLRIGNVKISKP